MSKRPYIPWQIQYKAKLNTPEWKACSAAILKRDKYICFKCGERATEVHHRYYQDIKNGQIADPWDYPPEDLVSLCRKCHQEELPAKIKPVVKKLTMELKRKFFVGDLNVIVKGLIACNSPCFDKEFAYCINEVFRNGEIQSRLRAYVRTKYNSEDVDPFL